MQLQTTREKLFVLGVEQASKVKRGKLSDQRVSDNRRAGGRNNWDRDVVLQREAVVVEPSLESP